MIIKIREYVGEVSEPTTWGLWVTETDSPAAAPIVMAAKRTPEQLQALLAVVMGGRTVAWSPPPATSEPTTAEARSLALYTLLTVLDGWVEGARSNHEACQHRGENVGEECWKTFHVDDIHAMVNDAARELAVGPFPTVGN